MRKLATFIVVLALLVVGSGLGIAAEKEIYIAVVSKGFQHQFWQTVKDGCDAAGADYGVRVTFEGPESEAEVAKQIDMLQAAIDRKPDALVFAALDSKAAIPLLERAHAQGIPIIAFDSGVESDLVLTTAATDNYAASAKAADRMAELIGYEGKVAVIVHDQTSITGIERRDGFVDRITENYPHITIVDVQYGGGDHLKGTDLGKAILQAHPDLKGFYGANEGSAVGVINAVAELDKADDVVVVGFDSGALLLQAIRTGLMEGAITQNPFGIGYKAVEAAVLALRGEELPEVIDTGFYWYDVKTMDSSVIAPLLYD